MSREVKKYIQAWDIETTGQRLQANDIMFAIGTSTLEIIMTEQGRWISTAQVETQRWVRNINPGAKQDWGQLWKENNWEQNCWDEFWSKHVIILNSLMSNVPGCDLYDTEQEMMDSVAKHISLTEEKYGDDLVRVYDTIGFDVTEISNALERSGYPSIFMSAKGFPCQTSYLEDIRNSALGQNPLFVKTKEQKETRIINDKEAIPNGLSHNHDPAMDAACIAWKWVHYWKMGPWFHINQDPSCDHEGKKTKV